MTEPSPFVATVPGALDGMRVDRAVAMLTGVSRSAAAELVASGRVRVEGMPVAGRAMPLVAGTEIEVTLPQAPAVGVVPDASVPFTEVYADEDIVVVDKPAGVVVHPGAGHTAGTLVSGLLARYPDIAALGDGTCDPTRPGLVHRIDKGTSGLLVVARTAPAYRSLAAQIRARTVGREYLALVTGHLDEDRGEVDAPIGRSSRSPTRMAVTPQGRTARTRYAVVRRLSALETPTGTVAVPCTLLACTLDTGRTHQIRVHLAAIGHPVVGDDRYGAAGRRSGAGILPAGRLFLHAAALALDHPTTGDRMSWRSPLPRDLAKVVAQVDAADGTVTTGPAVGDGEGWPGSGEDAKPG